jgi:hypothetical protein
MVVIPSVLPFEAAAALAGLLAPAAGAELLLLAELAHADNARARAASPAAPTIFRIRILLFTVLLVSHQEYVPDPRSVH